MLQKPITRPNPIELGMALGIHRVLGLWEL